MRFRGVLLRVVAVALAHGCGTSSVVANPPGTRGGDCRPDLTCEPALECVRGVCVPDDGTDPPRPPPDSDGGPWPTDGGPPSPVDAGEPRLGALVTGSGSLVDVFSTAAGILVVDQSAAYLVNRSGEEISRFEPGREITAASFDGLRLAVADRSKLTVLQPDLEPFGEVLLSAWCVTGTLVSEGRFVCIPGAGRGNVMTSYDVVAMRELESSEPTFRAGAAATRVPGTDAFMTVRTGSPGDFHLFRMRPDHTVEYLGESPYHGDIRFRDVFTFLGSPATHVVTHEGIILEIFAPGCETPTMPSRQDDCFQRDGDLGSLPVGGTYELMARDAAGRIYGLDDSDRSFSGPYCRERACTIHQVDPETRTILSERRYTDAFVAPVAATYDEVSSRIVLGVATEGDVFDGYTEYEVRLVSH